MHPRQDVVIGTLRNIYRQGHATVHYWCLNRRLIVLLKPWIPAFAGMTDIFGGLTEIEGLKAGAKRIPLPLTNDDRAINRSADREGDRHRWKTVGKNRGQTAI